MVAGHSVFLGANASSYLAPSDWFLQPYQLAPGTIETFIEHIRLGVEVRMTPPGHWPGAMNDDLLLVS